MRRAAWKRGEQYETGKYPEEEELSPQGYIESACSGDWIKRNILLGRFALHHFDYYFVSSVVRTEQSAIAMNLPDALWQEDPRLNERNRGRVRGLHKQQHRALYPESYRQMLAEPLGWTPPGGQSMLDVVEQLTDFYEDIKLTGSVLVAGHRDSMWAFMKPVEGLSNEELAAVNTDEIRNGQIWHYTSIDPATGRQAPQLMWKYSIDPMHPETATGWQVLPNIARYYKQVA